MELLMAHLVGDYIFQNDWLAKNKKTSSVACGIHVLLYTFVVMLFTAWPLWALSIVAVTHFAQDRTSVVPWSMRLIGKTDFLDPPFAPWSVILIDNIYHLLVLFVLGLAVGG